ncbi:MAG: carboxypeptidase-like regulatory domain-containing protein [Myxococcota bacterium]
MSRILSNLALVALLGGCAAADYQLNETDEPVDPIVVGDTLVLEVSPGREIDDDGTVRAVAATVPTVSFDESMEVDLLRPFTLPGFVTGSTPNPQNRAEVPGTEGPVLASLVFRAPGVSGASLASTASDGTFEVALVDSVYQVTVAPEDPRVAMSTFTLDSPGGLDAIDLELGPGVPVWGRVFEGGTPYADAEVTLISNTGSRGATALTDADGWYEIRAQPGVYTVRTFGIGDGFDPQISAIVTVGEQGLRYDFDYPDLALQTIQARALRPNGTPLALVPYRLRASSLDDFGPEARVEITGVADTLGNIVTRAVRGSYTLEILPDLDLTGLRVTEFEVGAPVDLGDLELAPLATFTGAAIDPFGLPVANAQVRCTELGFGGRTWSTFTSDLGRFSLDAAATSVSCAISPPGDRTDLALTRVTLDPSSAENVVEFLRGRVLEGVVRFEGQPEDLALVEVRDTAGRVWGSTLTDRNGRFSVRVQFPQ